MKWCCYLILNCLLLPLGTEAVAQIYKVVTPEGRVIYTDNPPEDSTAEEVDLPDLIIQPATEVRTRPQQSASDNSREPPAAVELPNVSIAQPTHQQVIPPGQNQVSVVAQTSGELPAGYRFQLLLNGAPQGAPVTTASWTLDYPNPGEQRAQVAILDASGVRQSVSEERIFYVIP